MEPGGYPSRMTETHHLCEVLEPTTQIRTLAVVTDPKRYFRSVRSLLTHGKYHCDELQRAYNRSQTVECSVLQVGGPEENLTHLARSLTHPSIRGLPRSDPRKGPGPRSRPVKPWTFAGDMDFAAQFDVRYMVRHVFNVDPRNIDDVAESLRDPPRTRPTGDSPFLLHHYRKLWDGLPHEQIRHALEKTADALEGGTRPKGLWMVMGLYALGMDELPDINTPEDVIAGVKGLVAGSPSFEAELDQWAETHRGELWRALCLT